MSLSPNAGPDAGRIGLPDDDDVRDDVIDGMAPAGRAKRTAAKLTGTDHGRPIEPFMTKAANAGHQAAFLPPNPPVAAPPNSAPLVVIELASRLVCFGFGPPSGGF